MSTFKEEICTEIEDYKESEALASVTIVRSNTVKLDSGKGKIVKYKVDVKVRDSKDFYTELSRDEAEKLFGLYTYYGGNITARNVANEFPRFTLSEVKKIFRAFKLTKDSAWFPPHMGEELTEEQLSEYRMSLKERSAFKYADARQERDFNKLLRNLSFKIKESEDRKKLIQELNLLDYTFPVKPISTRKNSRDLILYLSDLHVGAYNETNGYEKLVSYNEEDIQNRFDIILDKISKSKYTNIIVCNLGDSLDSYKKETTRGGHELPSTTSDKEKSVLFLKLMIRFFSSLKQLSENIYYYCVGESNHDGDWGWLNNLLLASKLEKIGVKSYISDKPIDKFELNGNIFLYLHGKNNYDQIKGFPLTLNDKTESWFNSYFINNNITAEKNIYVVKGDLHQHAVTVGKTFNYVSAASLYGCSNWIVSNFGKTPWGMTYMEISEDGEVLTGLITEK